MGYLPGPRLEVFRICPVLWLAMWVAVGLSQPAVAAEESQAEIVLIKVGGSSITNKATKETLNEDALGWFASLLANEISLSYKNQEDRELTCRARGEDEGTELTCGNHIGNEHNNKAFVVVHGAGSFGHQTAKLHGLSGQIEPPYDANIDVSQMTSQERRRLMHGLSKTRLSVQKLNRKVVAMLVQRGINAVAISPCFSVPGMQAHGGNATVQESLRIVVQSALQAGLVPVLHGDACLYGNKAGILSGDILMAMLGGSAWISRAVFLTDVDGVFTRDPRTDPTARILRIIHVEKSGIIQSGTMQVQASGSLHEHDVTGGLKVRTMLVYL